jgi:hypothetical protein
MSYNNSLAAVQFAYMTTHGVYPGDAVGRPGDAKGIQQGRVDGHRVVFGCIGNEVHLFEIPQGIPVYRFTTPETEQ